MNVFVIVCYLILIVAAVYGLFFGLVKVLTPIVSGALSVLVMLALKNWVFGFLFRWTVFQGERILPRIVVILLVFIVGSFLFRAIIKALNLITKLPILHGMNKLLGCAAGLFEGAILVWLLMYFIHQFPAEPLAAACLEQLQTSSVLTYLYEHNFVLFLFELFMNLPS